jgi:hypothetical protein
VSRDDDLLDGFFDWLADLMQGLGRDPARLAANTQAMTVKPYLPPLVVPEQPGPATTTQRRPYRLRAALRLH